MRQERFEQLKTAGIEDLLSSLYEFDLELGMSDLSSAWDTLYCYTAAAHVQMDRLEAVEQAFLQSLQRDSVNWDSAEYEKARERLHAARKQWAVERHYYFTCWYMVARSVIVMDEILDNPDFWEFAKGQGVDRTKRNHPNFNNAQPDQTLAWYGKCRNHFEHLDERYYNSDANQKKPHTKGTYPGVQNYYALMNVSGQRLQVGDHWWDFSRASLEVLDEIFDQVEHLLRSALVTHIEGLFADQGCD